MFRMRTRASEGSVCTVKEANKGGSGSFAANTTRSAAQRSKLGYSASKPPPATTRTLKRQRSP